MIQHLFSYGTLQLEKVQIELFGRLLFGCKDKLKGYKLGLLEIKDQEVLRTSNQSHHPIAIPSFDPHDAIEGMLLAVTEEELISADKYEVDDYARVEVTLLSGKKAWFYEAANLKQKLCYEK